MYRPFDAVIDQVPEARCQELRELRPVHLARRHGELGRHGNYRTNVWSYAGVNTFGKDRDAELALHPTVKPVALVSDAIKDASKRNGIVLDAFGGSGTTLVAAERTGRRGYALEYSPQYVDTIVKRVMEATGEKAVLDGTSQTFEAVRDWRFSGLDEEDRERAMS